MLLDASANVNALTTTTKLTPLMGAAMAGHQKTISRLVEASADLTLKSCGGLNALDMALRDGNDESAQLIEDAMVAMGILRPRPKVRFS